MDWIVSDLDVSEDRNIFCPCLVSKGVVVMGNGTSCEFRTNKS